MTALRMAVATIAQHKRCSRPCVASGHCECAQVARAVMGYENEACAQVAEAGTRIFLSPEYATNQPISSVAERIACKAVADAIRARINSV